jgi:hypothetical protein
MELQMAFNFSRLLSIVKAVSDTKAFDLAAQLAFKRVGAEIDKKAHDPAAIKEIAKELINGAPQIVGAIVKGSEAEKLVPAANIHRPDEPAEHGGSQ